MALSTAPKIESVLEAGSHRDTRRRHALVESKLVPPRNRTGSVERSDLVEQLRLAESPIVSVVAPAGYGKTTLLRQWADREVGRVAWLSLDEQDNDPAVLWTYLSAAVARVVGMDPDAFGTLEPPGSRRLSSALPSLVTALAGADESVVIMLDDLCFIHDHESRAALGWLAEHLPARTRLAIAGRIPPPFALGRLRTRGVLREVGVTELALSERETATLLNGVGVAWPESHVAELTRLTEGWPTGIYVAGVSADAAASADSPVEPFSGNDRLIVDYLRSEVFESLPPDRLRFLSRTSILERVSGQLCDAVLETTGSTAILESLERSNLFLFPLDQRREWYRYHGLFRDALRRQLEIDDPDSVAGLYARAEEWLEANGQADAAVEAAQAGGDMARLARLVGRVALEPRRWGHPLTMDRWFAWFDDVASLERWVPVAVLGAMAHAMAGRPADAERWAAAAARRPFDGPMPDGSLASDAWLAMLRAVMARDGVDALRADSRTALQLLAPASPWRPPTMLLLGIAELLGGEPDLAGPSLIEATDLADATGDAVTATLAVTERAVLAVARGDWVTAEGLVADAQVRIAEAGFEDALPSALTYAMAARLALRQGDFDAARRWLGRVQRFRPQLTYAIPWLSVQVRLELARAYLAIAEPSGARTLLSEVGEILRRRPGLGILVTEAAQLDRQTNELRGGTAGAWTLTTAELRLLPYLPTHLSFREIAKRLCVSLNTVKTQAISVYGKLGASSRSGAIDRAVEVGLLDPSVASLPGDGLRS